MSPPDDKGNAPTQPLEVPQPTPALKPSAPAWQTSVAAGETSTPETVQTSETSQSSQSSQSSQFSQPPTETSEIASPEQPPKIPEPEASPSQTPEAVATEAVATSTATASTATPETKSTPSTSTETEQPTLDQARVFLRDDVVRLEPRPRKAAFLESKGLSPVQIDELLAEDEESEATEATEAAPTEAPKEVAPDVLPSDSTPSVPPIVTYPEFLTRPQRPPPLVTPNVFLNTLYGAAGAASLIYGTARLVLAPMVDSLTDSRAQLHDTTGANLAKMIDRLESVVSEVPPTAVAGKKSDAEKAAFALDGDDNDDNVSTSTDTTTESYDDPTEVFHRDVGVQTSMPPSPALVPQDVKGETAVIVTTEGGELKDTPKPSAIDHQAESLAKMLAAVKSLDKLGSATGSGSGTSNGSTTDTGLETLLSDVRTTVGQVREHVDKLARVPHYLYGAFNGGSSGGSGGSNGKYPGYVMTTRNEPNDEIRKAKENIRRVKGTLLTTRTFPTAR